MTIVVKSHDYLLSRVGTKKGHSWLNELAPLELGGLVPGALHLGDHGRGSGNPGGSGGLTVGIERLLEAT